MKFKWILPVILVILMMIPVVLLAGDVAATTGTTVGTTTAFQGIGQYQSAQSGFFVQGLWWVFWHDGTNYVFSTAPALTGPWSAKATAISSLNAPYSAIVCDGTRFHVAWISGGNIMYKMGTPASDGSISWGSVYLLIAANSFPGICIASDNHIWIICNRASDNYPTLYRNSNTDDNSAWTNATGFPVVVVSSTTALCPIAPGTSGSMYVLYGASGAQQYFKSISSNGTVGGVETATLGSQVLGTKMITTDGTGKAYVVYRETTTNNIKFRTRSAAGIWDVSETTIATVAGIYPGLQYDSASNALYVFWGNTATNLLVYDKYSSGSWNGITTWVNESIDGLTSATDFAAPIFTQHGNLVVIYETKSGSPYNIKVAGLALTIAPVAAFSATPLSGRPGTTVTFTDASTNTPTNWTWNFGNGGSLSYLQNPTHTYSPAGTFTVSLKATNSAGSSYCNKTGYIVITAWAPTFTSSNTLTGQQTQVYSLHLTLNETGDSITAINLPSWLSLLHNGTTTSPWYLNGTPSVSSTYSLKLKAYSIQVHHFYSYDNDDSLPTHRPSTRCRLLSRLVR